LAADKISGPQLRQAIDSGATGEKVDYPDPAAAPLETDSEAGGANVNFPSPSHQAATRRDRRFTGLWVYGVAVVIIGLVAGLLIYFSA
jgi:hypothetical protein